MSDRKRTPLAERIAVSLLLRGYAHAPWITTRLRPTMVAQTWKRATGWRESLIENGRVILGSDADPAALDAYGRGVLESMQRYMEGIAVASRMPTDRLLDRLESVEGLTEFRRHFSDRSGRGIVLLSMHMGEFEPAAAYIGKHVPIHVLYHRDSIGTLERMRTRARRRLGVVGHAVDDGLGTWAGLRDVLGRGEVVGLAHNGKSVLFHDALKMGGVNPSLVPRNGLKLVDGPTRVCQPPTGNHGHVHATGCEHGRKHQRHGVSHPAGAVLVHHRRAFAPREAGAGGNH